MPRIGHKAVFDASSANDRVNPADGCAASRSSQTTGFASNRSSRQSDLENRADSCRHLDLFKKARYLSIR
jgi:hypothetical protein